LGCHSHSVNKEYKNKMVHSFCLAKLFGGTLLHSGHPGHFCCTYWASLASVEVL
jgi:hypothetical protein